MNEPSRATSLGVAPALEFAPAPARSRTRTRNRSRGASPARGESPVRHRARAEFPRGGTRERIQAIALELFAEQGYEKTSLREIAERLGVTKAALYYHFKSKEDIVHSFTEDYFAELDALLDWAKDRPRDDETRRELLDRYVGVVLASNAVFRFLEQNRASVQSMEAGKERFARVRVRLDALVEVLVGQDAPLRDRVRATIAVVSVGATCMFFLDQVDDRDKLPAIVLEMAAGL